jgi:glycosyltransferase involved in cell wall biosynthesis
MNAAPFFSVVIPVRDGGIVFERTLRGLAASSFLDFELIVVDDGSTDGSIEVAERAGAIVRNTSEGCGPGAARNLGADSARGDYLMFLDADCEVHGDTLERAAQHLRQDSSLDALFGSYDSKPSAPRAVSRYRNLLHHFTHQRGAVEASTFWAGCGVIRRLLFLEIGGFDSKLYTRPCIEDIELGLRLRAEGHRILLAKDVLVTHHKAWTFGKIDRLDFIDRALPWTRLILQNRAEVGTLNLDWRNRASTILAYVIILAAMLALLFPLALFGSLGGAISLLFINWSFYRLLYSCGGVRLTIVSLPLHFIYFLNNGLALCLGSFLFLRERRLGTRVVSRH